MPKLICILISLLASCNVVDSDKYLKPYDPGAQTNQSVLLEEYTGMKCVNCPAAAVKAQLLRKVYGDRLIVVSIHAGAFAVPDGIFTKDLRTEAGDDYFLRFRFVGTPAGAVNRAPYDGSLSVNPSHWASAVKQQIGKTSPLELTVTTEFNHDTRALTTLSAIKGIDELVDLSNLKLTVWLVEDSISTPQIIPASVDHNYIQRHVLRHTLSDTWGDIFSPEPKADLGADLQSNLQVSSGPNTQVNPRIYPSTSTLVSTAAQSPQQALPSPQQTATAKHTTALPADYNVVQCSIVAFISDAATGRVIQVTQKMVL